MAKDRPALPPTQWVVDSDETTFIVYVSVTKTMGTRAVAKLQRHHLRDDAVEHLLAHYRGDATDQSFEELQRVLRSCLDTARRVWELERERYSL